MRAGHRNRVTEKGSATGTRSRLKIKEGPNPKQSCNRELIELDRGPRREDPWHLEEKSGAEGLGRSRFT